MECTKREPRTAYLGMIVLQSVLYATSDVVAKLAYETMSVYCFLFLRSLLALAIMAALWHRQIFSELRRAPVRHYIIPALCLSTCFIFANFALQITSATNVSFVRSLSALLVPVLALIFFHQRLQRREIALLLAMLVGLYLLCARGGLGRFGLGEVLTLIAAALVAGSLVFGKSALEYLSARSLSFVQALLAMVFCLLAALLDGSIGDILYIAEPKLLASVCYSAIGCSLLGYLLQNLALEHLSPREVGIVQCLYPIFTAAIAFVVLHEHLSLSGLLGAGIITACVILENLQKAAKSPSV